MPCNGDCNQGRECNCELDAKRIAELEARNKELENNLEGVNFVYEKAKTHIEVLEADIMDYQAKLAIAVEALEDIAEGFIEYRAVATEALTKIKGE